jgi:hypothetical protein
MSNAPTKVASAPTLDPTRLPHGVRAQLSMQAPPATHGDRVHRLLSRLEGIRPAGDGKWTARCPAHEDNSPSLSIRDTGDKVLLHCFVGCHPDDILAAVGLEWSALYPDRWECAAKRPNEGAAKYVRRTLADMDPIEVERSVLRIAAGAIERGDTLTVEDQARIELAVERVEATR